MTKDNLSWVTLPLAESNKRGCVSKGQGTAHRNNSHRVFGRLVTGYFPEKAWVHRSQIHNAWNANVFMIFLSNNKESGNKCWERGRMLSDISFSLLAMMKSPNGESLEASRAKLELFCHDELQMPSSITKEFHDIFFFFLSSHILPVPKNFFYEKGLAAFFCRPRRV